MNSMKYIDLTHTFTQNMPVYPGDSKAELTETANHYDYGTIINCHLNTGMHVGTHMDAPLHMIQNGKQLSKYSATRFFGRGHLMDARGKPINATLLENKKISKGDIVLIMTGFSNKFTDPEYYESYPEITIDFATKMVEFGVSIVGMDTPSPDHPPFAIHKILLGNDILIIENLTNLENLLPHEKFTVIALPAKFEAEAAPTRVVAEIT